MTEPVVRPEVYRAYWHLACERQRVFHARLEGLPAPWAKDPIVSEYKFCNAYRASDRVSQALIRDIYEGPDKPEDLLLRTVMFRLFSKPETWRYLEALQGPITAASFDPDRLNGLLDERMAAGESIYTSAFILCANNAYGHQRKHRNHLALLEEMLAGGRLLREVEASEGLDGLYRALSAYPLIGPFMAYQLAIDINYSELTDFSENEFTVAGPGAVRGIAKVFEDTGGLKAPELIHWMTEHQDQAFADLGLDFQDLWGRPLQAIDCQNLFCETDKYSRVAFPYLTSNRTKIKARFSENPEPITYFYPPKWGLNERVAAQVSSPA